MHCLMHKRLDVVIKRHSVIRVLRYAHDFTVLGQGGFQPDCLTIRERK